MTDLSMDSLLRITLSDTFQNKFPEVFHKQVPNVTLASKHRNIRASQVALVVKTHLPMQEVRETQDQFLGWEDPLEKG